MRFRKNIRDNLPRKTHAYPQGVRPSPGEHPVIKSPAAAETAAAWIEGESGTEKRVNLIERNDWHIRRRLAHAEGSGLGQGHRVFRMMKMKIIAIHPRPDPALPGMPGDDFS